MTGNNEPVLTQREEEFISSRNPLRFNWYRDPPGPLWYEPGGIQTSKFELKKLKQKVTSEEHVPWTIWLEVVFIVVGGLCVFIGLIYFLLAITMFEWSPSVLSITRGLGVTNLSDSDTYNMLQKDGYDMGKWAAVYLFIGAALFALSCLTIYYGGYQGRSSWLISTNICHLLILCLEGVALYWAYKFLPTECDTEEFRKKFTEYFKWYGILAIHNDNSGHEAMNKINSVQLYVGCCGIDGYDDYRKIFIRGSDPGFDEWYPERIAVHNSFESKNLDYYREFGREVTWLSPTCCNPIWRGSLSCADGILEQTEEYAKKRLMSKGCVEAVKELCDNWKAFLTSGTLALLCAHGALLLILIYCSLILRKTLALIKHRLFVIAEGRAGKRYERMLRKHVHIQEIITEGYKFEIPDQYSSEDLLKLRTAEEPLTEFLTVADLRDPEYEERMAVEKHILENYKEHTAHLNKFRKKKRELRFKSQPPPKLTEEELWGHEMSKPDHRIKFRYGLAKDREDLFQVYHHPEKPLKPRYGRTWEWEPHERNLGMTQSDTSGNLRVHPRGQKSEVPSEEVEEVRPRKLDEKIKVEDSREHEHGPEKPYLLQFPKDESQAGQTVASESVVEEESKSMSLEEPVRQFSVLETEDREREDSHHHGKEKRHHHRHHHHHHRHHRHHHRRSERREGEDDRRRDDGHRRHHHHHHRTHSDKRPPFYPAAASRVPPPELQPTRHRSNRDHRYKGEDVERRDDETRRRHVQFPENEKPERREHAHRSRVVSPSETDESNRQEIEEDDSSYRRHGQQETSKDNKKRRGPWITYFGRVEQKPPYLH